MRSGGQRSPSRSVRRPRLLQYPLRSDYVVGRWEGGGTQTGEPFDDMPIGSLPARTGKTMRFTGVSVLKIENGLITEEIGLDDGVTVLQQLGLIDAA